MNDDALISEVTIVKFPPARTAHEFGTLSLGENDRIILKTRCGIEITERGSTSHGIATCRDCAAAPRKAAA